tara:strand:+ start:763 stop:1026 length:264 start_codon:yes stop_codon:yes gene_type:complete
MTEPTYEMRYTEAVGQFTVQQWHIERGATTAHSARDLDARPQWLTAIIDTARIGKRLRIVGLPPPEFICWFTTDEDYNLINFLEFDK